MIIKFKLTFTCSSREMKYTNICTREELKNILVISFYIHTYCRNQEPLCCHLFMYILLLERNFKLDNISYGQHLN